jgi:pyruvate, water dikinase
VSAEHTRSLDGLRSRDAARFGGKSASLGELLAAEIPVPPGFALSAGAFTAFVQESGLGGRIARAMGRVSPGDLDAIASASRAISEAMRSAPVPESVRAQLAQRYGALAEAVGVSAPPVAVRSSALGEDSQDATFAGQQETYLWVSGIDRVCDAVLDCWVSLYSPPAISYRLRLGPGRQAAAMGVTVQLMVDAYVSGVMFTCNPVSGDPSIVAVNASWGLGLAVVGGEVTPDEYLVSKVTREVVRERVNHKHVQYVPAGAGRGTVCREVEVERADVSCLDHQALATLVDVGRRVERHFGSHQDIEFAFARGHELPQSLFVVQSRPVTAVRKPRSKPKPASALSLVMSTFGADRKPPER